MAQAVQSVVSCIRAGEALAALSPFTGAFEEYLRCGVSPAQYGQIWRVVESVAQACFIPVHGYEPGQREDVATDQAWLMRIRLLAAHGFEINGLHSKDGRSLDDDMTLALKSHGISAEQKPIMRVWELVKALVEHYDPVRAEPPNPLADERRFDRYCDLLSASLAFGNGGRKGDATLFLIL